MKTRFAVVRKHLTILSLLLLAATFSGCRGCKITNYGIDIERRTKDAQEVCDQMNKNVNSMQILLQALDEMWAITEISPIIVDGNEVGYSITFDKFGPIYIYVEFYQNADDNHNYSIPILGVMQDNIDKRYYWILNGEWLLDSNGDKIPVDGGNGGSGGEGGNGDDDPVTPQLQVIDDYWCVSTDGGETWTQLNKVTDTDDNSGSKSGSGSGTNPGSSGSVFTSLTQDDDNVYITLSNGSVITIGKSSDFNSGGNGGNINIVDGAIMSKFSVSPTKQVYFSRGNLQTYFFRPNSYEDNREHLKIGEYRFAPNQYDAIGYDNLPACHCIHCFIDDPDPYNLDEGERWVDLFRWGNGDKHVYNYECFADRLELGDGGGPITASQYVDYGVNMSSDWRTLSDSEWSYVLFNRKYAEKLRGFATVNSQHGLILLPDSWPANNGIVFTPNISSWETNTYSSAEWCKMEKYGAVFLPTTGYGLSGLCFDKWGLYWASTYIQEVGDEWAYPYEFYFSNADRLEVIKYNLKFRAAVRLVRNAN